MLRIFSSIILSLVVAYCFGQSTIEINQATTLEYSQTVASKTETATIIMSLNNNTPNVKYSITENKVTSPNSKTFTYSSKGIETSNYTCMNISNSTLVSPDANILWISQRNFMEIGYGKTTFVFNDDKVATPFVVSGKENISVIINGTATNVEAYHLRSVGNTANQELWVLNNSHNPIILKAVGTYNLNLEKVL
jgi:hypothetical protein